MYWIKFIEDVGFILTFDPRFQKRSKHRKHRNQMRKSILITFLIIIIILLIKICSSLLLQSLKSAFAPPIPIPMTIHLCLSYVDGLLPLVPGDQFVGIAD